VWIQILRATPPWTVGRSTELLAAHEIVVADLVYVEVVRGARTDAQARLLMAQFADFEQVAVSSVSIARKAVLNYMLLRSNGITVRGIVDLLIATWCIEHDVPLLHADRDFEGFETHLGLRSWPLPP
jgi:predicted nucleic acid-binding protein